MAIMKPIAVLGAGNSGLAMAAHLTLEGHQVNLWSRKPQWIKPLLKSHRIKVTGVITGDATLHLVSSDIREVVDGVTTILVTTPANAHCDIAKLLAPWVNNEMFIVLNPGRTFGALEFTNKLKEYGCVNNPLVVETQTIIYTCRKTDLDQVNILAFKHDVLYSAVDHDINDSIMPKFPPCLQPFFTPAQSMIETSIGNVGMIMHCAPVLLNCGWIENSKPFKFYWEGISPSVARLIEKLDEERLLVASLLGHPLESTKDWLRRSYGANGDTLYECIQNNPAYQTIEAPTSLQHRYIMEDVSCGLVPLESMGRSLGLSMPICGLIINLANAILDMDFRKSGRLVDCYSKDIP